MLSAAEINDLSKLLKGKLDSEQHFVDVLNQTFQALVKDPIRVPIQLRTLYRDTEGFSKTI